MFLQVEEEAYKRGQIQAKDFYYGYFHLKNF